MLAEAKEEKKKLSISIDNFFCILLVFRLLLTTHLTYANEIKLNAHRKNSVAANSFFLFVLLFVNHEISDYFSLFLFCSGEFPGENLSYPWRCECMPAIIRKCWNAVILALSLGESRRRRRRKATRRNCDCSRVVLMNCLPFKVNSRRAHTRAQRYYINFRSFVFDDFPSAISCAQSNLMVNARFVFAQSTHTHKHIAFTHNKWLVFGSFSIHNKIMATSKAKAYK